MHLRHVESRVELQTLLKVKGSLLVFLKRLVHFAERKVLQPGVMIGRFHVQRAFGKEDRVVVELEIEENSGQV